ncbi:MAG TPA: alpha-amylase family glycosyl hydrolase [Vicinamibacteria bacterium]
MTPPAGALLVLLAAAPEVRTVEPPGWWPGHSLNPVRLLLRGRYLAGARLEAGEGLTATRVTVNEAGTSLFADVAIDQGAPPGARALRVVTAGGRAAASFELMAPLPRAGRFQGLSPDDVIYLLMPDRFANGDPRNDDPAEARGLLDRAKTRYYHGGDLRGVIQRLPYLKELGVTALWLNPWYENVDHLNEREQYEAGPVTDYHGYGATDFYAVDEHLGDLGQLRELVDAAHAHGIKVVQDQVANHTGPYHPWVRDRPTPTWYNGMPAGHGAAPGHLKNTWQTWTLMDPHAVPALQRETLDGWFIDILPDLNQDDEEVARYLIQNSLWWIGVTGLDAVRQDTLPYAPRRFWRDWTAALRREYPSLRVVGELFDGNPALVAFFQGGRARFDGVDSGIDTLFDFPLYFAVRRTFLEGKPVRELAVTLGHDHLYERPEELVTFLGLHDVSRFMGEGGATPEGMKLAYTFLFTTRGIPLVYYGDEIGMPGGGDPDNRRDFPGGWPGDARDAFSPAGRTASEQDMWTHVQGLARLRATTPALRRGQLRQLAVSDTTYAYARVHQGQRALVLLNTGTAPAEVEVEVGVLGIPDGTVLAGALGAGTATVGGGTVRLRAPARAGAVWLGATSGGGR